MMVMDPEQIRSSKTLDNSSKYEVIVANSMKKSEAQGVPVRYVFPKLRSSNGISIQSDFPSSEAMNTSTFVDSNPLEHFLNKLSIKAATATDIHMAKGSNKSKNENENKNESQHQNQGQDQDHTPNAEILNRKLHTDPESNETITIDRKLLKMIRNKSITLKKSYSVDSLIINNDSRKRDDPSYVLAEEFLQSTFMVKDQEQRQTPELELSMKNDAEVNNKTLGFTDFRTEQGALLGNTNQTDKKTKLHPTKKSDQRTSRFLPALNSSWVLSDINNMIDTMFTDEDIRRGKAEKTVSRHFYGGHRLSKTKSCLFLNEYLRPEDDTHEIEDGADTRLEIDIGLEEKQRIHENVVSFLNNFKSSWLVESASTDLLKSTEPFSLSNLENVFKKTKSITSGFIYPQSNRSSFSSELPHNSNQDQNQTQSNSAHSDALTATSVSAPKRAYFVKTKPVLENPHRINIEISKISEPETNGAKQFIQSTSSMFSAVFACFRSK